MGEERRRGMEIGNRREEERRQGNLRSGRIKRQRKYQLRGLRLTCLRVCSGCPPVVPVKSVSPKSSKGEKRGGKRKEM